MKKITLTLLGLVAFSTSALAQQEVKFGPKAGVNIANIIGKDATDNNMLIGFHVGAFAEIKFNEKFAIQPEIMYSTQGTKRDPSSVLMGISAKEDIKINYINVPIMAKYYIVPSFAVEAGPYVGFVTSANSKGSATIAGESTDFEGDIKHTTNSINFGVGAGASFNLDNGFFIGARYNLGLSKVGKDYIGNFGDVAVNVEALDTKNAVIQVGVGYKF